MCIKELKKEVEGMGLKFQNDYPMKNHCAAWGNEKKMYINNKRLFQLGFTFNVFKKIFIKEI